MRVALVALMAAALMLLAPLVLPTYFVGILLKTAIYALFAMSFNVVFGYLGLPSLGHAAFFGTSAYVIAIAAKHGVTSVSLQMLLGIGAALLVAFAFGPLSLRARGVYHFMITMALAQLIYSIAFGWRSMTGGDDGIAGLRHPSFGLAGAAGEVAFYYFALALCLIAGLAYVVVARSPLGRIFVGVRENEQRMRVLGYNVTSYQIAGIAIASVGAGLAGALHAYQTGYVGINYLSIALSAEALLMVIIGGSGTIFGPIIGAVVVSALQAAMSDITTHWPIILGTIYVVVVLWAPTGLVGLINDLGRRSAK
jgi:branched-chain amino acid transport system permease protein